MIWSAWRVCRLTLAGVEAWTVGRIGIEQGRRAGLLDGIALGLRLKFGDAGQALIDDIRQVDDPALIQAIFDRIETATTIEEIRQVYATPPE